MEKYQLISKINSPQDLKQFNIKELENSRLQLNFGYAEYVFTLKMCKLPNTNINVFFIDNPIK